MKTTAKASLTMTRMVRNRLKPRLNRTGGTRVRRRPARRAWTKTLTTHPHHKDASLLGADDRRAFGPPFLCLMYTSLYYSVSTYSESYLSSSTLLPHL